MLKHILLSSILVNNRVIVIENRQKIFQLQLQLSTFENFYLQLQQNCEIITIFSIPSLMSTEVFCYSYNAILSCIA